MAEKVTETALMKTLNWAYGKALDPGVPGMDSSYDFARDYSKEDGTLRDKVNSLIRWQAAKAGTSGFITGIGGIMTLPIAVPANISSVLFVQIRMIATIAIMGGCDPKDDNTQTLVYLCLCGNTAVGVLKQVGIEFGNKMAISTISKISGKTLTKINQKVGFRLLTKFGETGVINFGKAVPIAGGIIGGTVDVVSTNTIGDVARNTFIAPDNCTFCKKDFGFFERIYTCDNCKELFCDDHCCNTSYISHLKELDPIIAKTIKGSKYLCANCLSNIPSMPQNWKESIIDRTCAYPGCTESLSSVRTIKKSCKVCGALFCSGHSTNFEDYSPNWLRSNIKFQWGEGVCKSCAETAPKWTKDS